MLSLRAFIHKSLLLKLLVSVGLLLLLSLAVWGFFNFRYMQKKMVDNFFLYIRTSYVGIYVKLRKNDGIVFWEMFVVFK